MTVRPRIALPCALLALALTPALASSQTDRVPVRPQVGMAGVKLGESALAVRRKLGVPARIVRVQGGPAPYVHWRYPRLGLTVGLIGPRYGVPSVLVLETTSRRAITPRGVRMGASVLDVASAYPEAECSAYRGRRQCLVGEPGTRTTAFLFARGRLVKISMGDTF